MRRYRRLVRPLLFALFLSSHAHSQPTPAEDPASRVVLPADGDVRLDLGLAEALFTRNNRTLKVAQRAIDVAASEIRRADVAPNPVLSASVANSDAGRYRPRDSDRIVRIEQMFERGSKRDLRIAVARAGERVARLDYAELRRSQAILMYQAYYDLLGQQGSVEIALENAAGYTRLVDAAERRLRAGDIAAVDVARLRVEASRANADVGAAQAARARARNCRRCRSGWRPRSTHARTPRRRVRGSSSSNRRSGSPRASAPATSRSACRPNARLRWAEASSA